MTVHYELNCGQPVLHLGGRPVGPLLNAVGLVFSKDTDDGLIVLHKHGPAEAVRTWHASAVSKYKSLALANTFQYVEIPAGEGFPVERLNAALAGNYLALCRLVEPQNTIDL